MTTGVIEVYPVRNGIYIEPSVYQYFDIDEMMRDYNELKKEPDKAVMVRLYDVDKIDRNTLNAYDAMVKMCRR